MTRRAIAVLALALATQALATAATPPGTDSLAYPGPAWSPYLVGALIGVLSMATFYFSNKPLGASTAYARLAKLPAPRRDAVNVMALVRRILNVETRLGVKIENSPDLVVRADPDQLEQLLINLVHNAVDASLETRGGVSVGWKAEGRNLELWVDDEGAGLPNASNLFVPFFTTKPGGSGIGLVLCRQIAEAHGGTLTLDNREDRTGCRAYLRVPL